MPLDVVFGGARVDQHPPGLSDLILHEVRVDDQVASGRENLAAERDNGHCKHNK